MNDRLIIALDVESAQQARTLVRQLGPQTSFYKVGMELYAAAGMSIVQDLLAEGKQVFLDLKLYDIGETVKRAVARIAETGVHFLTVHGSRSIMEAAVAGKAGSPLQLLGVTVLTSLDEDDLRDLGYPCSPQELVALRARKAAEAGLDGLVCSPLEVAEVRGLVGPQMHLVTPGVRSAGSAQGDQKRVATPAQAIASGASHLVIGRQVTRAQDPAAAFAEVVAEVVNVRVER